MNAEQSPREMLPYPVYRGEHICWSIMASQHKNQGWNQPFAYISAHFHYDSKMMLYEMNQLSTTRCANVPKQCGNSSVPYEFPWISFSCYFWIPFLPSLTTNLLILYDHFPPHFQNPPIILQPFYQDLYTSLDSPVFINIAFISLPFFVITAIVFMGHQEGMEVKLSNSDTPYVSEMAQNILGSFSSWMQYLY